MIAKLEDVLEIVRIIGEVCELTAITKFFNGNLILGAVTTGTRNFVGKDGAELWERIGTLIDKRWDDVIDAIDDVISSPDVDSEAVSVAEAELLAAASAEDEDEPDDDVELVDGDETAGDDDAQDDDSEDEEDDDLDEDDEIDEDDFWSAVGIDPIQIITSAGEFFSLRCYLDDDPVFLGKDGKIFAFTSKRALERFLADDNEHDLSAVSTFEEIQIAATDGSLDIDVYDDNVYVLPGLTDDIADGPPNRSPSARARRRIVHRCR